ncbi:MAG: nucleoside recognition protein [Desulfobacterales bacterium]|nr:nucleoside recognition protein [Desulfobacterales bacterium]
MIEAAGWTRRLAILARPLFRFGRLGDRCGAAFTAAFASGVAANAMLQDFYKENKITRQQLYLTNFVNQFPAFFLHLPTTFFTVISMTGAAGRALFRLDVSGRRAADAWSSSPMAAGGCRRSLAGASSRPLQHAAPRPRRLKGVWNAVREKSARPAPADRHLVWCRSTRRCSSSTASGLFRLTRDWLADVVVTAFVPMESLSIVVLSFVAEFTSGFAAAGALMDRGDARPRQADGAGASDRQRSGVSDPRPAPSAAALHGDLFAADGGRAAAFWGRLFRVMSIIGVGVLFYVVA